MRYGKQRGTVEAETDRENKQEFMAWVQGI